MPSSAPPPRADRACTHLGASVLNDAWNYCSRMTGKMLGIKLSQGEEPQSHLTHCFCSKLEVKESPSIVDELPQSVGFFAKLKPMQTFVDKWLNYEANRDGKLPHLHQYQGPSDDSSRIPGAVPHQARHDRYMAERARSTSFGAAHEEATEQDRGILQTATGSRDKS